MSKSLEEVISLMYGTGWTLSAVPGENGHPEYWILVDLLMDDNSDKGRFSSWQEAASSVLPEGTLTKGVTVPQLVSKYIKKYKAVRDENAQLKAALYGLREAIHSQYNPPYIDGSHIPIRLRKPLEDADVLLEDSERVDNG